jgi:cytochrome c biogenesis protein CcmG/thiol:disulfide interchange protein DsbE
MRQAGAVRRRVAVAVLCAGLATTLSVASCSKANDPPAISGDSSAASNAQSLAALKRQAGIDPCPSTPSEVQAIDGGLPDITLGCLGGGRDVDLAGLRGTPTVMNVWAQWCGPCRTEVRLFQRLHERAGKRVRVIGIDFEDQAGEALAFAKAEGMTYPQLADPGTRLKGTVLVPGLPVTLFVASDGTIAGRQIGPVDSYDQLTRLVSDNLGVSL